MIITNAGTDPNRNNDFLDIDFVRAYSKACRNPADNTPVDYVGVNIRHNQRRDDGDKNQGLRFQIRVSTGVSLEHKSSEHQFFQWSIGTVSYELVQL